MALSSITCYMILPKYKILINKNIVINGGSAKANKNTKIRLFFGSYYRYQHISLQFENFIFEKTR